ncbi:FYVE zinc finger-domain-containing protein, partial [Tribonema minus]
LGTWMPNANSMCCRLCERTFTVVRRRHHCRMCGELVCNQCSPHRARLGDGTRALEGMGITAL